MSEPKDTYQDFSVKPFEFKGDGFEYFKIWIVNILLTILTLGIYSAWAKVRNNRYFYSNLFLDGHSFEYLANPLTILKSRLVAVVVFVIYIALGQYYPLAGVAMIILIFLALPWIIIRSLMFHRRMSAYRNVQFRFHGRFGEAAMALFVWPVVGYLTIGIMFPYAILQLNRFIVRNTAYGTTKFKFDATYGKYGSIILISIGIILLGFIVGFALSRISEPLISFFLPIYAIGLAYIQFSSINLLYNSAMLSNHGFNAELKLWPYAKMKLINFILIALTLGLYLPAAKVRKMKYISENIFFDSSGSLEEFSRAENEKVSALGEELGDVFDFDIDAI